MNIRRGCKLTYNHESEVKKARKSLKASKIVDENYYQIVEDIAPATLTEIARTLWAFKEGRINLSDDVYKDCRRILSTAYPEDHTHPDICIALERIMKRVGKY